MIDTVLKLILISPVVGFSWVMVLALNRELKKI
jgi:hypothetical protein